ncbi:GNAQ.2 family protein [Megaselia abdita]
MNCFVGTGESGKSTFIKQMRIIHGDGFSEEDKTGFKVLIYKNIFMAIQSILRAMKDFKLIFESKKAQDMAGLISCYEHYDINILEPGYVDAIKFLWSDELVQKCYGRRREYQLIDSAKYFLDNIDRIGDICYTPNEQDILRSRLATSGIHEYNFTFQEVNFNIIDVGGQRYERSKWATAFDNVTSLIFIASLSEYDQMLMENNTVNRLQESKALFDQILRCSWFTRSTFILFLNKTDLFEEKIETSNLEDYFPEYFGPKKDVLAAKQFILDLYLSSDNDSSSFRTIYHHFTCATDTENIHIVFDAVKDTILRENLKQYNMQL